MNILALRERLLLAGNTIVAVSLIIVTTFLVQVINSHIIAVLLAFIIGAWLWLVFRSDNNSDEYNDADYIDNIEVIQCQT